MKEYFLFSVNNIRSRKLRSWLTIIGIVIGIAAVVALISLGEGLRTAITSQFSTLGTDYLTVTASGGFGPPGTGVVDPLTNKELDAIKRTSGVEGAAGRLLQASKITFNKKISFGYIVSMPAGEDGKLLQRSMNLKAEKGRLLRDGEKDAVVVGHSYSSTDQFGKPIVPGSKILIEDKEFTVVGVMEKKGSFQSDQAIIMDENQMRDLFQKSSDVYDIMAVKVADVNNIETVKIDIEKKLRRIRDVKEGEENFAVQTVASAIASLESILLSVQIFIYIIAGISLLVGGIGIMNTMYTAVVERTKDIGIMKSIGAKNNTIFWLFFIESGLIGAIGGLVGILLGVLGAESLAFIGRTILGSDLIRAGISFWLLGGALLFSLVIGSFFGTAPAVQASKLSPVEALRYSK